MTTTMSELNPRSASRSDRERFGDVLALQRAAYVRDGAPSLTKRRSDLKKFKAANRVMLKPSKLTPATNAVYSMLIDLIDDARARGARIIEVGQGHWNFIELLRAPFGSRADTLLKFFLR